MGTQFWWFYDVLVLSITAGILYGAVIRGFNRGIYRMTGALLSIIIGFSVSSSLEMTVYEKLFQQNITDAVINALGEGDTDLFTMSSEALVLSGTEGEIPDDEAFLNAHQALKNGETDAYPEWFVTPVCGVIEYRISASQKPHAQQSLAEVYASDDKGLCSLIEDMRSVEMLPDAAAVLEERFYRPSYLQMIRRALYLMLAMVFLILFGIISSLAGSPEGLTHIRRGDHMLGFVAGSAEAVSMLCVLITAVRLLTALTDGQMLLFNPETIDRTRIFQYIYYLGQKG